MADDTQTILPRALLLDMDGTITEPLLDFDLIRSEMGIAEGLPILEAMGAMPDGQREIARAVLERHEVTAADASTLSAGCCELFAWVAARRLPTGIVTRNSRACAEHVIRKHGLKLDMVITRDDGPYKPDPRSIWMACDRLEIAPTDVWMIGDGVHDINAGFAAGVRTVWLSLGRGERAWNAKAWKVARDLAEVRGMLAGCVDRRGPRDSNPWAFWAEVRRGMECEGSAIFRELSSLPSPSNKQ